MSLVSKKIVFTVTNDLSYDQRMQRICTTLSERGAEVLLVGRKTSHSKDLRSFPFKTRRLSCFFEKGKLFYLEYNFRLLCYLLFRPCTAICAIDLDTLLPATIVTGLRGKKLGYDAHEFFTEVPEVVHRKKVQALWHALGKFCIPKTDFRYTVGPKLAAKLEEVYGPPFQVVRNMPFKVPNVEGSTPEFESSLPSQFVLYQGALNVGRGLEALIKASAQLELPVVIAGEGDLSQELRTLAQEEGVQEQVYFLGFVQPDDLKGLTKKAFLGYNLLENMGQSYYYSLANKFFDYTMAGVPCLISPFPEYMALQEQYGLSATCNLNERDIIETINALVKNQERYNLLRENCIKAREELNWENEARTLASIYEREVQ